MKNRLLKKKTLQYFDKHEEIQLAIQILNYIRPGWIEMHLMNKIGFEKNKTRSAKVQYAFAKSLYRNHGCIVIPYSKGNAAYVIFNKKAYSCRFVSYDDVYDEAILDKITDVHGNEYSTNLLHGYEQKTIAHNIMACRKAGIMNKVAFANIIWTYGGPNIVSVEK